MVPCTNPALQSGANNLLDTADGVLTSGRAMSKAETVPRLPDLIHDCLESEEPDFESNRAFPSTSNKPIDPTEKIEVLHCSRIHTSPLKNPGEDILGKRAFKPYMVASLRGAITCGATYWNICVDLDQPFPSGGSVSDGEPANKGMSGQIRRFPKELPPVVHITMTPPRFVEKTDHNFLINNYIEIIL